MLIWWVRVSTEPGNGCRVQEKVEVEMGWNGSDFKNGTGGAKPPVPKAKSPSAWRGAVAGIAVVAIAGIGLWFAMSGEKKGPEDVDAEKNRKIKEVKPVAAPKPVTNAVPEKPKRVLKTYVDERGIKRYEGGLRVVRKIVQPPEDQMNTSPRLFQNGAEHQIHSLLTIQPGQFVLGAKYNRISFEKNFKESLKHEIEILPTDTPDIVAEKEAVIEAKKTLKEAMDRGEDITKMMNEAREELGRLYRYRDELQRAAAEKLSEEGTTDKDVGDYLDAMNAMLKEHDIKPIKQKELARNILKFQRKSAAILKSTPKERKVEK